MKKTNRVIMIIVAVLLTLVLLSTSLVSGIFAKYVITKEATTTVSLKKFGVTLTVAKGANVPSGASVILTPTSGDTVKVTVSNVSLAPGESIVELVKFTVANKPVVAAKLSVAVTNVTFTNLQVAKDIGGLGTAATYVPLKFTAKVNSTSSDISTAWYSGDEAGFRKDMLGKIKTAIGSSDTVEDATTSVGITTTANTAFSLSTMSIGVTYPASTTVSGLDTDIAGTWLAEQNASVSVTYAVTIAQT